MFPIREKLIKHSIVNPLLQIAVLGLSATVLQAQAVTVDLTVSKSWSSGYIVDAAITNDTSAAVNGWTLGFKLGNKIEKLSRATFTGTDPYTLTSLSYSADIAAGASEPFSFTAVGTFNAANVGNCVFNGAACTLTVNGNPVSGGASSVAASSKPASVAASSKPASVAASSKPASVATSSKPASSKPASSSGFSDVVQPPTSCSNIGNSIPNNIKLHNLSDSNIERANFADAARWYKESGNIQRFQLFDGDTNLRPGTSVKRPRIEAFSANPWKRGDGSVWREFSANYYLASWDTPQRYAVFQIKTNDDSNFIIQGLIDTDGSFEVARRGKGTINIDNNVYKKPFNLRVRSNGFKFEVWYNCVRVIAENNPQPDLESSATQSTWRWGLYRQQTAEDKQIDTTTLYVTGPKFD